MSTTQHPRTCGPGPRQWPRMSALSHPASCSATLIRDFRKFTFGNRNGHRTTRITPRLLGPRWQSGSPGYPPRAREPESPMPADRDDTPCPACRLPGWLCVCAHAPRVATRTPLLLVVHVHDLGRTSNTARLLALAVRDAAVICHGVFPAPADPASHLPRGVTPVVLFPGRGARPLTPELVASLPPPPALVVPDGNWKQAGKMVKRLPLLAGAVKVALPARDFAGNALRRNRPGHRMSTYEAVAQALAVLEGGAVAGPLLDFYRRATDRMLLARGKLRSGDVYGGLDERSTDVLAGPRTGVNREENADRHPGTGGT